LAGLAGLGDLVLTCTTGPSRNRRVGVELARGRPLQEILDGTRMVAEGVRTSNAALALAARVGTELPIASQAAELLGRFEELVQKSDAAEERTRPVDVETIEALEELLLSADVGVAATERIVVAVRGRARRGESLRDMVKDEIRRVFDGVVASTVRGRPH